MLTSLNYGLVLASTLNVARVAAVEKYSLLQTCAVKQLDVSRYHYYWLHTHFVQQRHGQG